MVALQSTLPALGSLLVTLVGLALAAALIGALGSAIVQRLHDPVSKYRLLYAIVLLPVTLLAYGFLSLLEFGPALIAPLPTLPELLQAMFTDLIEFLAAGVVWLAAYAPTVRGISAVRDIELSTPRAIARMARYVLGLSAIPTIAITPLRLTPPGASPLAIAASVAVLVVVFVATSPWLIALVRSTYPPTGETADRIATLRERAGLEVRDTRVIDTDDEETANALVRGPPGYRRLFVTTTFLDRFDNETAAALLAVRAGRRCSHVLVIRIGTLIVGGLLLVASLTGSGPRWPLLGLAVGVVLVGFWLSRRGIRAGDDVAAERIDPATVADALDQYAEVHAMDPTRRRLPNPLSVNVALGDRIDRLREHAPD